MYREIRNNLCYQRNSYQRHASTLFMWGTLLQTGPYGSKGRVIVVASNVRDFTLSRNRRCGRKEADLHSLSNGLPFITGKYAVLLYIRNQTIMAAGAQGQAFHGNSLLILFSSALFTPLYISPSFATRCVSLSLRLAKRVFCGVASPTF